MTFITVFEFKMAQRIWKRQIVRMDIVKSREKSMVVHRRLVCLPHKLVVEVLDVNGLEDDNAVEDVPDTISK